MIVDPLLWVRAQPLRQNSLLRANVLLLWGWISLHLLGYVHIQIVPDVADVIPSTCVTIVAFLSAMIAPILCTCEVRTEFSVGNVSTFVLIDYREGVKIGKFLTENRMSLHLQWEQFPLTTSLVVCSSTHGGKARATWHS